MESYFGFVVLVAFAAITAGGMLALSHWLGPRREGRIHDMPFECGVEPQEIVRGRFSVKFFVVALLFVLFDIELIFLFAWAVVYQDLGLFGFMEMLVFLLVVLSGLFYSVKKGVLQWK
jgi:NADH-quinone oxidoreductase subunit A